jgi:hypothetical protein
MSERRTFATRLIVSLNTDYVTQVFFADDSG